MTSEQVVKDQHPKAEALFNQAYKYWGVFLDGRPYIIGLTPAGVLLSDPFATGNSPSNAWVNARKKLQGGSK